MDKFRLNVKSPKCVVLICSWNNEPWVVRNIESVLTQVYKNFRIIFIDDASTDKTLEIIKRYKCNKLSIIENKIRYRQCYNQYNTILNYTEDNEIIIILDGDDWFTTKFAITKIAYEYTNPNIWMTYGNEQIYPFTIEKQQLFVPPPIPENANLRSDKHLWFAHPRTHYSWLAKRIKSSDLIRNGKFIGGAADCALSFPMYEMAGPTRCRYISDVLYEYNINANNYYKIDSLEQSDNYKYIKTLPPYQLVSK